MIDILSFSGWIAERYGYQTSLITAGIFMGASGFVTFLIPLIRQFHRRKAEMSQEQTIQTNVSTVRSDSLE